MQLLDKIKEETVLLLRELKTMKHIQTLKFYFILSELLKHGITRTKREIYYLSVNIFKKQHTIDRLIKEAEMKFQVSLRNYITTSLKGLFYGPIEFSVETNGGLDVQKLHGLIPNLHRVRKINCTARCVLVIEKDAIFSFITERTTRPDILYVCGKGYGCNNTIQLLLQLDIPKFGLFDFDPFGLHIFLTYLRAGITNFIRIGIMSSDLLEFKVKEEILIKLSNRDLVMLRNNVISSESTRSDGLFIKGLGYKLELEAFLVSNPFFYSAYIDRKLKMYGF